MSSNRRTLNLVVINGVLACLIGTTFLSRTLAIAQEGSRPTSTRLRGEYTMMTARTNQGGAHAVWVLDAANAEMVALKWDQGRQSLIGAGYRAIQSDTRVNPGR